jgi:CysZ protein
MNLFNGINYNLKGLWLGIRTAKLLFLGLVRFVGVIIITIGSAGILLLYHQDILNLFWTEPESIWILWLWHLVSWMLVLFLVGLAAILSYLVSQVLFSVIIMDIMSQVTERVVTGRERNPEEKPTLWRFLYLIRQEIPRVFLPVLLILFFTVLGWLTPAGPILTVISSGLSVIFLAWDNTDLIPARRLDPFNQRFKSLMKNLPFHLGFGLLFLIPGLNILFLSFAPVGATLYAIDKQI